MRIKTFFQQLKRAFEFFKLGFEDYDWDYAFLVDFVEFKLEKMRKYFSTSDISDENKEKGVQLGIAIHMMKYLKEERWQEAMDNEYKAMFGKYPYETSSVIQGKDEEGNLVYTWDDGKTEEQRASYLLLYDKWQARRDEVKKELFQYLHDNIEKWWD